MKLIQKLLTAVYLKARVKDAGQLGKLGIDGKVTW